MLYGARMKRPDRMTWDFEQILAWVELKWWNREWGFKRRGLRLQLHTGGWSGNEELVQWLQGTYYWAVAWQKSERGGHYWFHMPQHFKEFKDAKG